MIIARVTSGLGNQLFQFAAGLALAKTREVPLAIDTRWYSARASRESHESLGIGAYLDAWVEPTHWDLCWVRGRPRTWPERANIAASRLLDLLRSRRTRRIRYATDGDFGFDDAFFDLPPDTYLDGNWQSEKFFLPAAGDLRQMLGRYRPGDAVLAYGQHMSDGGTSAFLHVRRGDYVTNSHFAEEIGALSAEYYHNAYAALVGAVGTCRVFVFSNDEDWARRQLARIPSIEFVPTSVAHSPQDILFLMSRCQHAILANSSLSWWGAWLGRNSHHQFVAAPSPWFANSWRNTRDLLPSGWVTVPR